MPNALTSSLINVPLANIPFTALNSTGTGPLAGGKLYSYLAGSLTPYQTYSSNVYVNAGSFIIGSIYTIQTIGTTNFVAIGAASNTVGTVFTATGIGSGTGSALPTNTNPVILNSNGQASIWVDGTDMKFNLTDSNGAQQPGYPVDQVQTANGGLLPALANTSAATNGAGLIGFNPALTYPAGTIGGAVSTAATVSTIAERDTNGALTAVSFITTGNSNSSQGEFGYSPSNGAFIAGKTGSVNDYTLFNPSYSGTIMNVPTGTNNANFPGQVTSNQLITNTSVNIGTKANLTAYSNASPVIGDIWYDSTSQSICAEEGATGYPVKIFKAGTLLSQKVAPWTVTFNTASYFSLLSGGSYTGSLTLPANFWTVGKTMKIELWCDFVINNTTGLIQFYPALGSVNFGSVPTPIISVTGNYMGKIEVIMTCTSTGSSGSFNYSSSLTLGAVTTASGSVYMPWNGVQNGVNTTIASLIDIQCRTGVAGTSYASPQNFIINIY